MIQVRIEAEYDKSDPSKRIVLMEGTITTTEGKSKIGSVKWNPTWRTFAREDQDGKPDGRSS